MKYKGKADPLLDQRLTARSSREAFGTSFCSHRRDKGVSWVWYVLLTAIVLFVFM